MDPLMLGWLQHALRQRLAGRKPNLQTLLVSQGLSSAQLQQLQHIFPWADNKTFASGDAFVNYLWSSKLEFPNVLARAGMLEELRPELVALSERRDWHTINLLAQIGTRCGHQQLLEFLLTFFGDHIEKPPLLVAAVIGHRLSLAAYLLSRYKFGENYHAFLEAVKTQQMEMLQLLLQYRPRLKMGYLDQACKNNNLPMARLLLEHGARATDQALEEAATHGNLKLVRLLHRHGARDFYGHALCKAVHARSLRLVRSIYAHRQQTATVNVADKALLEAAKVPRQRRRIVRQLLVWGATSLDSALKEAAQQGNLKVVQLLVSKGATQLREAAYRAAQHGHLRLLQYFIKAGVTDLRSLLYWATYSDSIELLQYLVEAGASGVSDAAHDCFMKGKFTQGLFLLKYLDPRETYRQEDMFDQVIRWGKPAMLRELLAWHKPNWKNRLLAAAANNAPMLEVLLETYSQVDVIQKLADAVQVEAGIEPPGEDLHARLEALLSVI